MHQREREQERESKRENKREERSRKAMVLTIFFKISLIVEYNIKRNRQMNKDIIKRNNPMLVNALDIKFSFCLFSGLPPANCFKFQRERETGREREIEGKRR